MISRMSLPICSRFHTRRVNSSNVVTFQGILPFDARVCRPPWS